MSSCLAAIHCSLWPLHCSGSRRRRLAGEGVLVVEAGGLGAGRASP